MTNRQAKLCRVILSKKRLPAILKAGKVENYVALQYEFEPRSLDFSDMNFDDNTIVTLQAHALEEYENHRRAVFYQRASVFFSVCALIVSILALLKS